MKRVKSPATPVKEKKKLVLEMEEGTREYLAIAIASNIQKPLPDTQEAVDQMIVEAMLALLRGQVLQYEQARASTSVVAAFAGVKGSFE